MPIRWRRNAVISLLLAALVAIVQLVAKVDAGVLWLSTAIAFVVALLVLAVSDRYSSR